MSTPPVTPTCYRHPDRVTYVRCARCNRYICPECMRDASVGHQCVDCVNSGARQVRQVRTQFGGVPAAKPTVTYVLIGLNVVMFALQILVPGLQRDLVLQSYAVADGDLYRMLTSAFLHYGAAHILFNMWALYVVGPPLEAALGRLRYSSLYLLSALGGSVLVYLLSSPVAQTAGASGAVFGLFGAVFVVGKRLNMDVRWVIALIAINLAFTFVIPLVSSQNISWQGHIGGLVTGAAIATAYAYAPRGSRTLVQAGATAATLVVFALLIWWRTAVLLAPFGMA
ncbi:rhomboid family intramembrane serine protease [Mycolicibacterium celeriflavum]|uniref:Rhomboid family intramembrane serine protease n=1 Tax=Mycolicibacterium celeriflavum TaxID=1249101 RepID=A0A1X0C1V0_MYCCF|nr:rhomboid family intramembrane serine protease [Mycolicibacterium celeriflavum]MCV7238395.1 rhomboid family intramembrane serine protease [Mycolicibacterium celeriflavum]ORA51204.1 rhomboid family intramembrane serine protease [Mycolicibacterium celeriflavum]BBY44796.1 rhomboid family intramembrane serine protease [Mycolicibacterium celeriflavum]